MKKKQTGRHTIMTTETVSKLREAFLMGYSDREACIYADIGLQTLYDYQRNNPGFSELKEGYKINPILLAKKTMFNALEKGDIKVALWYLERKAKNEFSTRSELREIPSEDEIEITLTRLETDYELFAKNAKDSIEARLKT